MDLEPSERVYTVDKGIYYIMISPGSGLRLRSNDGPRAYYKLDVQLWETDPTILTIPSLIFKNLNSVRLIEDSGEQPKVTVLFDSIEKGLPTTLDYNLSYTIVAAEGSTVRDYYLHCSVNTTFSSSLLIGSQGVGREYEVRQGNMLDESQKIQYQIETINLLQTDLGAGVETLISLQTDAGVVSVRFFYNNVDLLKKFVDELDVSLIIILGNTGLLTFIISK